MLITMGGQLKAQGLKVGDEVIVDILDGLVAVDLPQSPGQPPHLPTRGCDPLQ